MLIPETTCWTVIRGAAAGNRDNREELARRYIGLVRAYLADRWRGSAQVHNLEDAVQEVFLECFRQGGALDAAGAGRVPNFRAFLYGLVRNIARRFERSGIQLGRLPPDVEADQDSLSKLFEKTWARSIMAEAAKMHQQRAGDLGGDAAGRVKLLQLRFQENLPIRTIAERLGVDVASLHRAYALARKEFKEVLLEVVAFHHPGSQAEVELEAAGLLKSLS